MVVNNITRLLDAKKIPYKVFELPGEKLGALETARLMGVVPELVYKTIVITREKGKPILAVIPGSHRVDIKKMAHNLGEKKLYIPTEKKAESLTGMQAGGISPLALANKGFQVVIASEAENLEAIHISGGQRGLNLLVDVLSLAALVHARFANISVPGTEQDFGM